MTATKKERDQTELITALRWTPPVERDVPPPESSDYSEGWDYNSYNESVEQGWSTATSHGSGPIPAPGAYRYGSQHARRLFSTKQKALMAMRYELEMKAAQSLLRIDRQLKQEARLKEADNNG